MPKITVTGSAESERQPERATLEVGVGVGTEASTPEEAVEAATEIHAAVSKAAAGLSEIGAASWWAADSLRTGVYDRYDNTSGDGRAAPTKVYTATAAIRVRFTDFEALGRWAIALAARPGVTIGGVEWALAPETLAELTAETRRAAVVDARRRAETYAAAAGFTELALVSIAEPAAPGAQPFPVARAMMDASPRSGAGLAFTPAEVRVSAAVEVEFTAS